MISKMLPFLNKLIPVPLAIKGLQKLNPKMNQLFANAAGVGYGAEEVMDFLREQTSPKQRDPGLRPDEAAAQSRIEQGTQIPELLGKVGGAALGGAGIASIPEVIGTLFDQKEEEQLPESEKRRLEALQKFKEKKEKRSVMEEERERFNSAYPQKQKENITDAFSQMGQGITSNFYKQVFDALQNGKDTIAGIKDPIIQLAKPYFEKGMIQSPDDIKNLYDQNQKQKKQPQEKSNEQAMMIAIQKLLEFLG